MPPNQAWGNKVRSRNRLISAQPGRLLSKGTVGKTAGISKEEPAEKWRFGDGIGRVAIRKGLDEMRMAIHRPETAQSCAKY